jgi:DNA polymerase IV
MQDRTIVHLDLDSFFVSVERLINPSLKGKPVIIGGTGDRGVVSSCSYEARAFGVHSAMPSRLAKHLCPHAIFIRGDLEQYERYSKQVTEVIADRYPVFEKASIDEHYIDISGMDKFFGSLKWTQELRQRIIRETGLPISFGLSVNKTVSKIATGESKPNGELEIPKQMVIPFLDPLPVDKMPMVGSKTGHLLRSMGVNTLRTLRLMPPEMLMRVLGENGKSLWNRANGIDNNPVEPYSERKSISTETTFQEDTTDPEKLNNTLVRMVEELGFSLRKQNKLTACITVKLRYSNFDTHTKQAHIPYTASDHILLETARNLFSKLYERRMLIRLVGVRLSHLVSGHPQINLFEDSTEMVNLYQAIDRMKKRYGESAVIRAVGIK